METNATFNLTILNDTNKITESSRLLDTSWYIGIAVSSICVLVQTTIVMFYAKSRKYDELVLLQLSIARLINTIAELLIMNDFTTTGLGGVAAKVLVQHSDAALISWMCVFSMHLFDKIVLVFPGNKNIIKVSFCVWLITAPVGILCPIMNQFFPEYFSNYYYRPYAVLKFIVILINVLLFVRIFLVACIRSENTTRNSRGLLKTAAVWFGLVSLTSLQVFLTDIVSIFLEKTDLVMPFCVLNSYQVIPVTALFLVLVRKKLKKSVNHNMSVRLTVA